MSKALQVQTDRIAALEARVAQLETAASKHAAPGDVITMGGDKWLCRAPGRWRRLDQPEVVQ